MSRVSRVPYHQNVYDLLQIEPGESPEAARVIAGHEAQHGPLPASVREWHLSAHAFRRPNPIVPLEGCCKQVKITPKQPGERQWFYVALSDRHEGWVVYADELGDPEVWSDNNDGENEASWSRASEAFSEFAFGLVLADRETQKQPRGVRSLWLRSSNEPFQPPVIDFLIDRFGEPERTPRAGNVTTYTYRPPGGTVRVTADEPGLTGGLSAWWVHADSPERLAEFARLLMPWGTLRKTLRADTDPACEVLRTVRE